MKTAIVTGASGNLGPVWIETLNEMLYYVIGFDEDQCDISDVDEVNYWVHRNWPDLAPSVLVLNAAIDNSPGSEATFHGNLERIIAVNLIGACNVVEAFLPKMIDNGGGVIIGISSIQAHVGADYRNYQDGFEKPVGYNLSKAGLEQYMRSLTVQYGRYGIRACCIGFGCYDSGKVDPVFLEKYLKNVPLGRPVSRQSAKAALRFAVECPEFAGQTVMVEGGYLSL